MMKETVKERKEREKKTLTVRKKEKSQRQGKKNRRAILSLGFDGRILLALLQCSRVEGTLVRFFCMSAHVAGKKSIKKERESTARNVFRSALFRLKRRRLA